MSKLSKMIPCPVVFAAILALSAGTRGADLPVPGRLIFSEDFSKPLERAKWPKGSASKAWAVADGVLKGVCAPHTFHGPTVVAAVSGRDLVVEFRVKFESGRAVYFALDGETAFGETGHLLELKIRASEAELFQCRGTPAKQAWHEERRKAFAAGQPDPQPTAEQLADPRFYRLEPLAKAPLKIGDGRWHTFRITVAANRTSVDLDDRELLKATGSVLDARKSAFSLSLGEGVFWFDDVRVWDIGAKP